ncbi:MAG: PIN domain-containing protein [Gammaproteobacteria bacterium]|nr:PIN domain-containing protein [Gammaproteobacteria bacterium]
MRHYIVDTSVLVAGFLAQRESSPTVRWLRILLEGTESVVVSTDLLAEYRVVLQRKAGMATVNVEAVLEAILSHALVLDPPPAAQAAPDPGDAHLWALLAADPKACLVTGDSALIEGEKDGRALNPKDAMTRWLAGSASQTG